MFEQVQWWGKPWGTRHIEGAVGGLGEQQDARGSEGRAALRQGIKLTSNLSHQKVAWHKSDVFIFYLVPLLVGAKSQAQHAWKLQRP